MNLAHATNDPLTMHVTIQAHYSCERLEEQCVRLFVRAMGACSLTVATSTNRFKSGGAISNRLGTAIRYSRFEVDDLSELGETFFDANS
jgi:hypothetical protein